MSAKEACNSVEKSSWNDMYERLQKYHQTHGHCCVSCRHDASLSKWVLLQITHYRKKILNEKHKKLLLDIGFRFPSRFPPVHADDCIDDDDEDLLMLGVPNNIQQHANFKYINRNATPPWPFKTILPPWEMLPPLETTTTTPRPISKRNAAPASKPSSTGAAKKYPPTTVVWSGLPDDELQGGWPPGWHKETQIRASGDSKGTLDSYWYTPPDAKGKRKKLRSMVEVRKYLGKPPPPKGSKTSNHRKMVWDMLAKKQEQQNVNGVSNNEETNNAKNGENTVVATTNKRVAAEMGIPPIKKRVRTTTTTKPRGPAVVSPDAPRFTEEDIRLVQALPLKF